ncbi:MAG TPA: hypothetical protein VGR89_05890 [Puia sp.]|nr:hypothetical protein [Puia sp.]
MKRIWTIRLFPRLLFASLVIALVFLGFNYVHARAARQDDANTNGEGKCEGANPQSQFVLWETLAHNLLISKH